jgi:hypothetical protein
MSRRSVAGYVSIRSCETHVAEAITTVRVRWSTATTDHVADAEDAEASTSARTRRKRNPMNGAVAAVRGSNPDYS